MQREPPFVLASRTTALRQIAATGTLIKLVKSSGRDAASVDINQGRCTRGTKQSQDACGLAPNQPVAAQYG